MPRFFIHPDSIHDQTAVITGSDADHMKVLRLKPQDEITVCDGEGNDYLCCIREMAGNQVTVEILQAVDTGAEANISCTILAGMPKGERADFIIQKCTELGASEIIFFLCKRCVARPDEKSMRKKLVRFEKIAESAAKQSGRGIIPKISAVSTLKEALEIAKLTDLPLFLYETGDRVNLRDVIEQAKTIHSAAIITGPEGGFEEYEVDLAKQYGMQPCAMGPRILRCETAPMAALTALMYATGNL